MEWLQNADVMRHTQRAGQKKPIHCCLPLGNACQRHPWAASAWAPSWVADPAKSQGRPRFLRRLPNVSFHDASGGGEGRGWHLDVFLDVHGCATLRKAGAWHAQYRLPAYPTPARARRVGMIVHDLGSDFNRRPSNAPTPAKRKSGGCKTNGKAYPPTYAAGAIFRLAVAAIFASSVVDRTWAAAA